MTRIFSKNCNERKKGERGKASKRTQSYTIKTVYKAYQKNSPCKSRSQKESSYIGVWYRECIYGTSMERKSRVRELMVRGMRRRSKNSSTKRKARKATVFRSQTFQGYVREIPISQTEHRSSMFYQVPPQYR